MSSPFKVPLCTQGPKVIFSHWREMLSGLPVSNAAKAGYELAIRGYLDYCARNSLSVTVASVRAFMEDAVRRQLARNPELWRAALNWYFRERQKVSAPRPEGVPSPGQVDTGGSPCERRLIERLRLDYYSWRTERTYPEWARRQDRPTFRSSEWLAQHGLAHRE